MRIHKTAATIATLLCLFWIAPTTSVVGQDQKAKTTEDAKQAKSDNAKAKKPPAAFKWINKATKTHKALQHATFHSPSLKVDVGYYIVLPPGYENQKTRFPVVYFLHGGRPGSEAKGVSIGALAYEHIKADDVSPAIYVFPNGGPVSHYNIPGEPTKQGADVFIKELIPHIDRTYRTIANRSGRALEGFSQGGRATMRLALRYPELFCSAAAGGGGYETEKRISQEDGYENPKLRFGDGDNAWDLARAYAAGDSPKVRWMIYVGTDGFNYKNNLEYMRFLKSQDIPHQKAIAPDAPHSAKKVYEKVGLQIMRFHAKNFVEAATIPATDGQQNVPSLRIR